MRFLKRGVAFRLVNSSLCTLTALPAPVATGPTEDAASASAAGYYGLLHRDFKRELQGAGRGPSTEEQPLSITIKHCVEHEFFNLFRADLAATAECVELLSPFISPYRSSEYYPVFMALSARSVPVHAYVRPREEQPESLRPMYAESIRNLQLRGVRVLQRSGMHEKVAALDGKILWHGSLNILSHNDSRESMLRFESTDLVQEVLHDLGIKTVGTDGDAGDCGDGANTGLPEVAIPACTVCNGRMRLFSNAGVWLCEDSPRCPGVRSVGSIEIETAAAIENQNGHLDLECPICNSPMAVTGVIRRQITCPNVSCGFQLEPRLSAGILRILSRRRPA